MEWKVPLLRVPGDSCQKWARGWAWLWSARWLTPALPAALRSAPPGTTSLAIGEVGQVCCG